MQLLSQKEIGPACCSERGRSLREAPEERIAHGAWRSLDSDPARYASSSFAHLERPGIATPFHLLDITLEERRVFAVPFLLEILLRNEPHGC